VSKGIDEKLGDASSNAVKIKYATILGEFKGTLEGILWWDIPNELKERLKLKIKQLDETKY
jgi:hypothetical protein